MFKVSLSAFGAWQSCEQKYFYSYVRRLRPMVKDVAPQRGIILHEYLETYYRAVQGGASSPDAHGQGLAHIESHQTEFQLAASIELAAGRIEEADGYANMMAQCVSLADRYWHVHGRDDAERYEFIVVERPMSIHLVEGIMSTGVIDLVAKDRITGRVHLWEHKTGAAIPDTSVRLRDFQTLLYAEKIRTVYGIDIDSVLWNYIRTKPPTVPHVNKNGKMSRAEIDSTWETYESALKDAGLNPLDYTDMREKLLPRETTVYYPRFEHVIVADSTLLLEDYAVEATRMRRAVWEWENGRGRPIRSITRNCNWCQYYRVCEAEVMGGDGEDIIQRFFLTSRGRDEKDQQKEVVVDG